ncbi:MAG: multicopper oxidase domain-containing protein, partial [Panacibacter sp.]
MKKLIAIIFMFSIYSLLQAQDMKGMDMNKKAPSPSERAGGEVQPITYTCPMHLEIHSAKPGNCPKCGMKLVKEKPKPVKQKPMQGTKKMDMHNDTIPKKNMPAHPEGENMEGMDMKADTSKDKMMNMDGMQMNMSSEPTYTAFNKKYVPNNTPPRTVRYDLYIKDTTVTFGKKPKRAIAVNGQIPMPTLTFTEGDTAEIVVHNMLDEETSLHWHGLFLPNQYDGVPNLTQMPIKPHATHLYRFPIIQSGTHFYHSHSMFQEQIGMYGMFIMNKRKEWDIPTIPITLSEWADMKPGQINRRLHNASDWFAIEKGTTQSYAEAIKTGHFKTKITNEWKRMNA